MNAGKALKRYFKVLLKVYGPQHWWPAETPFEVMIGAILTQNTNWTNVEKAIANLKILELLTPEAIHRVDVSSLARAIRPTGYFNVKAKRVKAFVAWLWKTCRGDVKALARIPPADLRTELLEISGIGKETADSILLYGLNHPVFVVDAYTYRVLARHRLVPQETSYDEMQDLFHENLRKDPALYNEFHALFVAVGKEFCRKVARCEKCPLKRYLPGPVPF